MLFVLFVLLEVTVPVLVKTEEDQSVFAIPPRRNYGSKVLCNDLGRRLLMRFPFL